MSEETAAVADIEDDDAVGEAKPSRWVIGCDVLLMLSVAVLVVRELVAADLSWWKFPADLLIFGYALISLIGELRKGRPRR